MHRRQAAVPELSHGGLPGKLIYRTFHLLNLGVPPQRVAGTAYRRHQSVS
jgi:hypothetical protein